MKQENNSNKPELIDGIWTPEEYEFAKAWGMIESHENNAEEEIVILPAPGLKVTLKREWSIFKARHTPSKQWIGEAKVAAVALALGWLLGLMRIGTGWIG